jgi:hypothetical protein
LISAAIGSGISAKRKTFTTVNSLRIEQMAIFAILMPTPQPSLVEAIKATFPKDHYALNDTQWLISASGTVTEISAKLGIYDPTNPTKPVSGLAVVFAVSSYFGRGPATVWDWLRAKLEAPPSGATGASG